MLLLGFFQQCISTFLYLLCTLQFSYFIFIQFISYFTPTSKEIVFFFLNSPLIILTEIQVKRKDDVLLVRFLFSLHLFLLHFLWTKFTYYTNKYGIYLIKVHD